MAHLQRGRKIHLGYRKNVRRSTSNSLDLYLENDTRYAHRLVSIKGEQEVVSILSNGDIADDLAWPQITPIFTFCVFLHIFGMAKASLVFRSCTQVGHIDRVASGWNNTQMGVVTVRWLILIFFRPHHIFGIGEAGHVTFGVQVDTDEYSARVIDYHWQGCVQLQGHMTYW